MTLRKEPRGWVAVRVPKQSARAYLAWIDPRGDLYWNGGPGHCPYSTHEHEVLRRYRWGRKSTTTLLAHGRILYISVAVLTHQW